MVVKSPRDVGRAVSDRGSKSREEGTPAFERRTRSGFESSRESVVTRAVVMWVWESKSGKGLQAPRIKFDLFIEPRIPSDP